MIHGIGTDLVRISRLDGTLARHGDRFPRRILDPMEYREYLRCTDRARFLAKRFAAKEAAAKAFGTGIRDGLRLAHLVVSHGELGEPLLELRGHATTLAARFGIVATRVSLSDEGDYALAFVVLETAGIPRTPVS